MVPVLCERDLLVPFEEKKKKKIFSSIVVDAKRDIKIRIEEIEVCENETSCVLIFLINNWWYKFDYVRKHCPTINK